MSAQDRSKPVNELLIREGREPVRRRRRFPIVIKERITGSWWTRTWARIRLLVTGWVR